MSGQDSSLESDSYGREEDASDSQKSSASEKSSDSVDDEVLDRADDMDVIASIQRHGKLQRETKQTSSSSDSSDVEDDVGGVVRSHIIEEADSFITDGKGRPQVTRYRQVVAAANPSIGVENMKRVFELFGNSEAAVAPAHDAIDVGLDLLGMHETVATEKDDEFERECDRIKLQKKLIEHTEGWMMDGHFKGRDQRLADMIDDGEGEDEDEFVERQHGILRAILKELLGYGSDSEDVHKVPQFVIKYRSDIYDVKDSIFSDLDVYSIRDYAKKFAWVIDMRKSAFVRLGKAPVTYQNERTKDQWKECEKSITQRVTETKSFSDFRRYCEYVDTEDRQSTHVLFFKQRALFGKLVEEFLLHPNELTMNMNSDPEARTSLEPPEPSRPPLQLFELFFDENPKYAELCEAEAKKAMAAASAKGLDMDEEITRVTILEQKIVEYASEELAVNPYLLYQLREQITSHLVVNTAPTEKGKTSDLLLPYGKYGPIKRLKGKPTSAFDHRDTWLLIDEARKAGYISVTVDLDYENGGVSNFFDVLASRYKAQYSSSYDTLRDRVVKRAFDVYIWPQFVSETESDLMNGATDFVKDTVEQLLFTQLTAPPFLAKSDDPTLPKKSGIVLSFCYHPDFPRELAVVLVNSDGIIEKSYVYDSNVITTSVSIGDYTKAKITAMLQDKTRSSSERAAIKIKAELHKMLAKKDLHIDVVVVAATCLKSKQVFEMVNELVSDVEFRKSTPIIFAPADAALIYTRSELSAQEKRDLSQTEQVHDMIIAAASVARRVQNPLSELTRLCASKRNYLADLPLHPFQSYLKSDTGRGPIYDACERACLKAVAISGVDVFKLYSYHHRGPLQFVPGLGPKWADRIIAKLSTNINSREKLSSEVFGDENPTIKTNAIGFIRFPATCEKKDRTKKNEDNRPGDILDGTLIHVNDYELAKDLIRFKMEKGPRSAVQQKDAELFFAKSQHFTDEELTQFCETYDKTRTRLLDFIVQELSIGPYQSLRFEPRDFEIPREDHSESLSGGLSIFRNNRRKIYMDKESYQYCPLTDQELFDLLLGHDSTLAVGAVAEFRVVSIRQSVIVAEHPSGLEAFDDRCDGDKFVRDAYYPAVILDVDIRHLRLRVSFRKKYVNAAKRFESQSGLPWRPTRTLDSSFDVEGEERAREEAEREEKRKPHKYPARIVVHEKFREITYEEARKELLSQPVGSFLFRPSSKGPEHLSLNVRFPGESVALYDIVERKKQSVNDLALGQELYIEGRQFDDLEEIRWEFANPLATQLNDIVGHRKWVEDIVEARHCIISDLQTNPRQIPYRITIDPNILNCVTFMWFCVDDGRIVKEPIRPTSQVFRFRHCDFPTLESAINYWKQGNPYARPSTQDQAIPRKLTESEDRRNREEKERHQRDAREFGSHGPRG